MLSWGSSVDIVGFLLSWAARALSDFFSGQSRTQYGPLHMKRGLRGFGTSFLPSNFPCPLLLLGGFFCPQSLRLLPLFLRLSPPPFALVGLFVFGLDGVFRERFRNGDGVVKCLNTTLIKLGLGPILEAILKVEERIHVGHVAYLQHKGSELVDVVPHATRFLETT